MNLKEKILRSRFLPFLDNLRYAWATIVALCSQQLSVNLIYQRILDSKTDHRMAQKTNCLSLFCSRSKFLLKPYRHLRLVNVLFNFLHTYFFSKSNILIVAGQVRKNTQIGCKNVTWIMSHDVSFCDFLLCRVSNEQNVRSYLYKTPNQPSTSCTW